LNDDAPLVTVAGSSVQEGTPGEKTGDRITSAPVTLSLSQPTTLPVAVTLETQNASASGQSRPCGKPPLTSVRAGESIEGDFTSKNSVVNIPAGTTTVDVSVGVCKDSQVEPDENLTVVLSNPVNATLGSQSSAQITIRNDDLRLEIPDRLREGPTLNQPKLPEP
jgi:hypothetical protein